MAPADSSDGSRAISPLPSANGGAEDVESMGGVEDLEETRADPKELLANITDEIRRLWEQCERICDRLPEDVLSKYMEELEEIKRRSEFWQSELEEAGRRRNHERARYFEDIRIGESILLDRVLKFAAVVFAEPIDEKNPAAQGLRRRFKIRPRVTPRPAPPPGIFPGLVNHDVGFGMELSLRMHQEEGLHLVRGWFASQKERLGGSGPISPQCFQATIVMPVGSGKTRLMVASFAAAIEGGVFRGGEIEAVFTVDALVEGADLYMFTHQLGARPTFSQIKKRQERGRTSRHGPNDIGPNGKLLNDRPRIIFDVVDDYKSVDRSLARYGDGMGITGHARLPEGELLDVLSGEVVDTADRNGRGVRRKVGDDEDEKKRGRDLTTLAGESLWAPMAGQLREILNAQYDGDIEAMAADLGEAEELIEGLLNGVGWENNRWFLRRLATLLYQGREDFLSAYNGHRGIADERVTAGDLTILRGALALYAEWSGSIPEGGTISIKGSAGFGEIEFEIAPSSIERLERGAIGDQTWRTMWRSLACYFRITMGDESGLDERRRQAAEMYSAMRTHFFSREGWVLAATSKREELLIEARELVALRFGGALPGTTGIAGVAEQVGSSLLTQWIEGKRTVFDDSHSPKAFCDQVRALLTGMGVPQDECEDLIRAAVFEERNWKTTASSAKDRLLLRAREVVAARFGGILPGITGIAGISGQGKRAALTRWLDGERIEFNRSLPQRIFYTQIRALLTGLGLPPAEADRLIEEAIAEGS